MRRSDPQPAGPPAPRRVAYFVNLYPAVSHSFIRREIRALEALGWEVHRFAIRCDPDIVDPQDRAERERTTALLPLRAADLVAALGVLGARPVRSLRALAVAARLALRSERGLLRSLGGFIEAAILLAHFERLAIPHAHAHFGTNSATVLHLVRALGGPPYSFTNHAPLELHPAGAWSLAEKVAAAAFTVAISRRGRAQLMHAAPVETWSRIHVVRCGLELAGRRDDVPPVPDTTQLLCVGRLSPEKGHLVLLDAVGRLRERGVPLRLVIAGDGPLRDAIERRIRELDLDGIDLRGFVEEEVVDKLLRESRALVLPSLAEGLPVVLMESFRLGRPVIASDVGAISELVVDGESGWVVPPADAGALASAMRAALSAHPDALTRMGRAGHAALVERHDSAAEARKLSSLLEEALAH